MNCMQRSNVDILNGRDGETEQNGADILKNRPRTTDSDTTSADETDTFIRSPRFAMFFYRICLSCLIPPKRLLFFLVRRSYSVAVSAAPTQSLADQVGREQTRQQTDRQASKQSSRLPIPPNPLALPSG